MPTRSGRQRSAHMSPIRQTSFTGRAHGTHPGPRVSRSGRHSDMNLEVLASGAVTACGRACPNAATVDGVVLTEAKRDKERKYTELLQNDRCQLVVVGVETGGRWSPEAVTFVEGLAASRTREAPVALRFSSFLAWRRCCRAFCGSLTSTSEDPVRGTDGAVPGLADLFSACKCRRFSTCTLSGTEKAF